MRKFNAVVHTVFVYVLINMCPSCQLIFLIYSCLRQEESFFGLVQQTPNGNVYEWLDGETATYTVWKDDNGKQMIQKHFMVYLYDTGSNNP